MLQEDPTFHVYRYRVRPLRPGQEALAFQALGNSRWVYNQIVSLNRQRLDEKQKVVSKVDAINLLPEWKREHEWLCLGPSQPLQQTVIDYWQGMQAFFDDPALNRPPVYKKKFDNSASLRFPQPKASDWNPEKGWVNLPKLGQLKYFKDPRVPHGTLKQVQLVREGGRWFVCLCVEQSGKEAQAQAAKKKIHTLPPDPRQLQDNDVMGLDFGHAHALTDHLGRHYDFPTARLEHLQRKVDRIQAVVEHKRKAAKAWKKHYKLTERAPDSNQLLRARAALQKAQAQINDLLRDTRHQLSHWMTDLSPVLGVEDLKLKKLLENIDRSGSTDASSATGASAGSGSEPETKAKDAPALEAEPKTKTKTRAGAKAEVKIETKFGPEAQSQSHASVQAQVQAQEQRTKSACVIPASKEKPTVSATERFRPSSKTSAPMPRAKEKALHQGWARLGAGIILNQLEYKAKRKGGVVVKVNPAYTSQTCPSCKHVDEENRKSQAVFSCKACGFAGHADQVGAINVRTRAVEALMREGFPRPKPPKHKRPRNPRKSKTKGTKEIAGASATA